MPEPTDLLDQARHFLGDDSTVVGAGILGLKDSYLALAAGALAAGVMDPLPDTPVGDAVAATAGMRTAREARARSQGLSVRMLVAVTTTDVHLLEVGAVGIAPVREALSFDRATLAIGVRKFGFSRRVILDDGHHRVELTGSVSPLSPYTAGTRSVLAAVA